jgi:hypothetical protein
MTSSPVNPKVNFTWIANASTVIYAGRQHPIILKGMMIAGTLTFINNLEALKKTNFARRP